MFKYAERAELAPLLKALVQEAAMPLRALETSFAVDSTGFATNTYSRWFDAKYGEEKRCRVGITTGRYEVSATIAFRIAKFMDVSLYQLFDRQRDESNHESWRAS